MNEYNETIVKLLWEIENKCDSDTIDEAYNYLWKYCDNPDECGTDDGYDFSNAIWGFGEPVIIYHLERLLNGDKED